MPATNWSDRPLDSSASEPRSRGVCHVADVTGGAQPRSSARASKSGVQPMRAPSLVAAVRSTEKVRARTVSECWCAMLTDRGLNDRVLYGEVPKRIRGRLNLSREALDKELEGTRRGKVATGLKNATHSLHSKVK